MSSNDPKLGFLIMPFDKQLEWLHEDIIHASVDENLDTHRADNIAKPGVILDQIFQGIDEADVVFAVCTGRNANVFLELGYAWRNHKPILIAEGKHDLSFDVAAYRSLFYGEKPPGAGRTKLRFDLRKAIHGVLEEERLPRGRRLVEPPQSKQVARLTARLQESGRSHRFIMTNVGTVTLHNVMVSTPAEARSFQLHGDELPIDIMRPGDSVKLLASIVMGGGSQIFDVTMTAQTKEGEDVEFFSKISL